MHRQLNPKVSVSIVFVAAMFMSIMDGTIVNVALPSIGRQLGIPSVLLDAVVVAYLVSLAVVIPASGWLGDRWGTKRIFLLALALFTIASALCGLAGNFTLLVLFRCLQGAAGGALAPVGTAMLYRTFPPAQRVQISSILIIPTVIAPATGPVLGGLLVDQWSWRWVFFVNVPIGMAAFVFGLLFLQEHREAAAGRFDLPGFLLAGSGQEGGMIGRQVRQRGSGRTWARWSHGTEDLSQHGNAAGGPQLPQRVGEGRGPPGLGRRDGCKGRSLPWHECIGHASPREEHEQAHEPQVGVAPQQAHECYHDRHPGEPGSHEAARPDPRIEPSHNLGGGDDP